MVAIPNAAFCTLYFGMGAQLAINVIGARITANPVFNQALANALGSPIKSAWTTNLATLMSINTSFVRVGIRDMRTANQPEFRDAGAAVAGSAAASDAMPAQVAAVATLRTALSGKSFRGRVYIAGWAEAANDTNGRASAAVGTGIVAFLTAVDNALKANGLALAVVSRPALAFREERHTTQPDGSIVVTPIGKGNARVGGAEVVTIIESRNTTWETQRTRMNSRGAVPTIAVASAEL